MWNIRNINQQEVVFPQNFKNWIQPDDVRLIEACSVACSVAVTV